MKALTCFGVLRFIAALLCLMSAVEGFCFSSCGSFCGKGFITSCCSGLLVRWKISSFNPHIIQQCLTSDCPVTALTYVTYVMCYHYFIKKTLNPATSHLCHDNLEFLQVSKCLYTLCLLFVCCYHLYVLVTVPLLLCTYLVEFDIIKGPEIVLNSHVHFCNRSTAALQMGP